MKLNHFLPIISAVILFISWEVLIYKPTTFFYILAIVIATVLISVLKLNSFKAKKRDIWLLLMPVALLSSLATVFLLLLNTKWIQHLVALIIAVVCYYFLQYLHNFLCRITAYKPLSLESSSSYFIVVSYLFLGISTYGFMNFLNARLWYLALIIIIVTFFASYQIFWINKIDDKHNLFASILLSMLMVEFFWSISFFPVSHFISGLGLAIIYYVIVNLSMLYFLDKIDKKMVKMYLSIGLGCLLVILLSARWL